MRKETRANQYNRGVVTMLRKGSIERKSCEGEGGEGEGNMSRTKGGT